MYLWLVIEVSAVCWHCKWLLIETFLDEHIAVTFPNIVYEVFKDSIYVDDSFGPAERVCLNDS